MKLNFIQSSRKLSYLFVSPNLRRAGVGTKLVQHFLTIVGQEDPQAKIGFTSSPTARFLYEKQGFRPVAWFEYTFDDVNDEGKPYQHRTRWPYMANCFQGTDEEMQKLSARQAFDGPVANDPEQQMRVGSDSSSKKSIGVYL